MILVESPGLQTTVQDLGRPGYGPLGISTSGAADPIALRVANALVGNPPNAAALETTMIGGRYRFEREATIAITGARCEGNFEPWTAIDVPAGAVIEIGPAQTGARAYLAVAGGIQVPLFLGSASTHLMTGLGGWRGRALRKGDLLPVAPATASVRCRLNPETLARLAPRTALRITYGPQIDWFTSDQRAALITAQYRVTQDANRMGLRLEGPPLVCTRSSDMITEGVSLGAVQVPSSGQPIILFVEQQTTGGYPKIANVISADLAGIGQLRPGDSIRFEWVSIETARTLLREQERLLTPQELFLA